MNDRVLREFEPRRQHAFDKLKWSVPAESRSGRFLDVGCGCGGGLVAALQHGHDAAVGVDRSFREFTWFDVRDFDRICGHYGVHPAKATLIEGDFFELSLQPQAFSCVMLLDSIEHVPEPRRFIETAARYVAPGGYLLIDTAPLYYSKVGHHLWVEFPPEVYPWAHLRKDWQQLQAGCALSDWSLDRFRELNKVTHDQIREFVVATGLQIVHEHRDMPSHEDLALLERHRAALDLQHVDERLLFESWVLIVARRN